MNDKKYIESQIRNSKALTYLNDEMLANRKALADALLERAKDWDIIRQLVIQVKGLTLIAEQLLTAVDLKHLDSDKVKETHTIKHETWLRLSELREDITDVDDAIKFLLDGYHTAGDLDDAIEAVMTMFADETKWKRFLTTFYQADNHHSVIEPKILNIEGVLRERLKQFLDIFHESEEPETEPEPPTEPPFDPHELD